MIIFHGFSDEEFDKSVADDNIVVIIVDILFDGENISLFFWMKHSGIEGIEVGF